MDTFSWEVHALNSKSQTRASPYCNYIGYWNVVYSFLWTVKTTVKLDFEATNIFLWVLMVSTQAPISWQHILFDEFGFLVHKCA